MKLRYWKLTRLKLTLALGLHQNKGEKGNKNKVRSNGRKVSFVSDSTIRCQGFFKMRQRQTAYKQTKNPKNRTGAANKIFITINALYLNGRNNLENIREHCYIRKKFLPNAYLPFLLAQKWNGLSLVKPEKCMYLCFFYVSNSI